MNQVDTSNINIGVSFVFKKILIKETIILYIIDVEGKKFNPSISRETLLGWNNVIEVKWATPCHVGNATVRLTR